MAEKKKPKPGPSTGGSSTSRIKKPKGTQPLTLGTGLRTSKVSKKQVAGTRKLVANLAGVTPIGRGVKLAKGISAGKAKLVKYADGVDKKGRIYVQPPDAPAIVFKGKARNWNQTGTKAVTEYKGYSKSQARKIAMRKDPSKAKTARAFAPKSVKSVAKKKK